MKKKWILYLVAAIALVALLLYVRSRIPFDWGVFVEQLKRITVWRIFVGISFIYVAYVLRAFRWTIFVRPTKKISAWSILGSQIIGFTAVALFGRLADLVRPYLIARRVKLSLGSQVAVYAIERTFDLGAMVLIFSAVLLFAPDRATLPHHELLAKGAKGGLIVTLALAVFAVVARLSGEAIAIFAEKTLGSLSKGLGSAVAEKIRAFRHGLNVIGSFPEFLGAAAISIGMWALITGAYLQTTLAFVDSPQLSSMTLSRCMVLMAASIGGSAIQLPVIGWFTTILATSATMKAIFNVAPEPALGCGAMLLIVTFMSVVPLGLIWAQFEHVSLRKVSEESEHAVEEPAVAPTDPVSEQA